MAVGREAFAGGRPALHRLPFPEGGEGAEVVLRELSAKDLKQLRQSQGAAPDAGHLPFVYDLLWRTLCDDRGERLFSSAADVEAAFDLPVRTLQRLTEEALRVSGIETAEKN